MSDTPTPAKDKKSGRFTGDDLAKIVKPSADLSKLGGEKLNDVQAQQIIMDRLSSMMGFQAPFDPFGIEQASTGGTDSTSRDLAEVIIDALPADLRTDTVAAGIDLRPYLKALDGKTVLTRDEAPWYLGGSTTGNAVLDTKPYVDAAEVKAKEDAVVAGAGGATPVSTKYDPTKAGITPTATAAPVVDPTTGQVSTPGVTIGPNGEISFGPSAAATSPFTINDLRQMVQGDHWTLEQLAQNEDQSPTGQFPIDLAGATSRQGSINHPALSTNDALSYLRTQLSPQEIHSMQLKLANAGYFDKLNNGGAFTDGVVDDNTQAAWKLLLTDSVIQNRPTPVILGEGLKNYREQTRQARLKTLGAVDPSYARMLANEFGQSTIGRDLTGQETDDLLHHLETLRYQRAGNVAGTPQTTGRLPGDEQNQGYTANDVQQYEMARTAKEQRDNNQRSISFAMSKLVK